jgi:hypothetical protein
MIDWAATAALEVAEGVVVVSEDGGDASVGELFAQLFGVAGKQGRDWPDPEASLAVAVEEALFDTNRGPPGGHAGDPLTEVDAAADRGEEAPGAGTELAPFVFGDCPQFVEPVEHSLPAHPEGHESVDQHRLGNRAVPDEAAEPGMSSSLANASQRRSIAGSDPAPSTTTSTGSSKR